MPMRRWLCAHALPAPRPTARARIHRNATLRIALLPASAVPLWRAASGSGSVAPVEVAIVVAVFGGAELALHRHVTRRVVNAAEFLALDRAQHATEALAAAAAARLEGPSCELP